MEPGTVLLLIRSIEHEAVPENRNFVRMTTKHMGIVVASIPNTNSVLEHILFMATPGGIIPVRVPKSRP
jgi:hypothetical protein